MSIDQSRGRVIGGEPLLQGTFSIPRGVYAGMVEQAQAYMTTARNIDTINEDRTGDNRVPLPSPVRSVIEGDQRSGVHFLGTEVMPVVDAMSLPSLAGSLAVGYPDFGTGTGMIGWENRLVVLHPSERSFSGARRFLGKIGVPVKDEIRVKAVSRTAPVRHS